MTQNNIGKVIRFLREEKGISIKKLCHGLCSESMLIRYETGERLPDSWIAERLLGRLGKSMNQIEQMMSQKEYGNIQLQMEIGELLDRASAEPVRDICQWKSTAAVCMEDKSIFSDQTETA